MTEKAIEMKMGEAVRKRGGLFYKFISPNTPGVPDRILITPAGAVWFVELKTDNGRLSGMQRWQKAELEKRNANVRVIYGWEEAQKFVQEVLLNGI